MDDEPDKQCSQGRTGKPLITNQTPLVDRMTRCMLLST